MGVLFVFCADALRPSRVDAHFAAEAEAVRALGHDVALVDHDALLAGDAAAATSRVPSGAGPAWYRGWMMSAQRYAALSAALSERRVLLGTSPDQYRRAHELPGWYGAFAAQTPRSTWLPLDPAGPPPGAPALAAATAPLGEGPAVVKDYVKSRKHEWDEACYVPELADTEHLASVVARFAALQGDDLAGGIVVRAFESFVKAAGEARVWWTGGEAALVTAHPDTPDLRPAPDLDAVRPLVRALGCPFVTTDLALHEDGRWRVVEVGDGQVSDLPAGASSKTLASALSVLAGEPGGAAPSHRSDPSPLRNGASC
ncbi:ATP-grasp domain-containing protein [Streptomyces sp. ME01-24h]|nr:ATP-grasp domain-containing protein [Streptomyces sp. ME19-03-3]MDX3357147.1 ATP-grasp domain-containing protein [Streptomyces sp. ME01-24h]